MDNLYEKLSKERKQMQEDGTMPEWFTTGGWQLFKDKYLWEASTVKEQYERIAKTAASHMKTDKNIWEDRFFELFWKGWLSPSTPVLANMGTNRGLPVSCSGQYVEDSIDGFYSARREAAILTKYGFGTSGYLGDIRPRGSKISIGGKASGVLPVLTGFVQDMRDVAQGTARRGAFASYLPVEHGDFYEVANFVEQNPDDANIGWNITDEFIAKLDKGDVEANKRNKRTKKLKMVTGKGYFWFGDKVNRARPQMYKDLGLDVKASNLCSEIALHSSKDFTYTCVLSSMNASKWHEWKDTNAAFYATVFLDCVVSEFIEKASNISGLEKAVAFTKNGRALGLGLCGLATLFQQDMLPFESFEAHMLSNAISKKIWDDSEQASIWLATINGEPLWCKGYGVANTHRIAIAPTKSTALIMGGISEGINPDPAMVFTQPTAAGDVLRANPTFLALMKSKGKYDKKHFQEVVDAYGSVQGLSWLTDKEKLVFRTGFEMNQEAIIRMASSRQKIGIDQGQSLNLWFGSDATEKEIERVHKIAYKDENILALYYIYSSAGVAGSKGECMACM